MESRTDRSFSINKEHTKRSSDVRPLHITAPLPLQFLQTAFCIPGLFIISAASPFGVGPVALINVTVPKQTRHFRLEGLVSSSCIIDDASEYLERT
jgi:hypothetical protein